jgi:hypothetical protein
MAEAAKERERLTANIQTARERQAGSSTKGADNEHALAQVIQTAFSRLPTYVEHPKKRESGDMLFTFQGINVMVEAKNYAKTVPEAEVRKAERDMASTKCDVLLFVSENSGIQGRMEAASNTLIGVFEGKPSAFVSNFAEELDKTGHIMMVVRTLIAISHEQKKSVGAGDTSAVETAQKKTETLLRLFRDSSGDIQDTKKHADAMRRSIATNMDGITKALDTFKTQIDVKVAAFKCRLDEAQSDGATPPEAAASEAGSETDASVAPPPAKRAHTVAFKGPVLMAKAKELGIKNIKSKTADQLRDAIAALQSQ